tara:strand:+ start:554 stop:1390 length:837 start_codon:yes stop_codon:yes gene_type:complete
MKTGQQEINPKKATFLLTIAFLGILTVLFSSRLFYTIPQGFEGYIFYTFGNGLDKENVKGQGFHLKFPWDNLIKYDVRIQEDMSTMEVLAENGLTIAMELSYRYNPMPGKAGYIEENIGSNYQAKIIIPEIRSVSREVIGEYLPEELYSTKRETIEDEIFEKTQSALNEKFINLDAVLIRDVTLPQTLQDAIEKKLKQEQETLEYDFKIEKAEKEAQRQRIEAQGKADANDILNASLTENVLRDKGIEATIKLSESPNSKVVVVGSGKDGLPLILGNN